MGKSDIRDLQDSGFFPGDCEISPGNIDPRDMSRWKF